MKIPRIFHRIWLGEKPMPEEFRAFGLTWEKHHPGWQMKLWTEANLPPLFNRWAFENSQTRSGQSNVLRYELLFRFGGVYIDTDFECKRNIEPLLANVECFAGRYGDRQFEHGRFAAVNNAILGSVPHHPFVRNLVEEVEANMRTLADDTPLSPFLTGPIFLTYVLQRHPEVKLFPARYFYPYGPRERWRRGEAFPRAYAVHHWSLNGLSLLQQPGRRFSTTSRPCLSIVLQPVARCDPRWLQWVLEGLCAQTVADFEVIALWPKACVRQRTLLRNYRQRLRLRIIRRPIGRNLNQRARLRTVALQSARARRILFLDSDCLPDRDLVARHAVHADRPVLVYGYRRVYPRAKLFSFRDAIDYDAVREASRAGTSAVHLVPSRERWRDVNAFCFSVPVAKARAAGGFDAVKRGDEVRMLARRLAASGCPTLPCIFGSTVTALGGLGAVHKGRLK